MLLVKSAWILTIQQKAILHFSIGSKVARDKINQIAHKKARGSLEINLVSEAANLLYILGINKHYRGAPRAVQSSGKFGNHVTVHRTNDRPCSPQGSQCLFSHFLACSLGAQEKLNCTSMLWSIDSCQNRVSADQYHITVPRAQVSTHRGRVIFEVIRWQITSFKRSQAQVNFFNDSYEICCVHVIMAPHY